MPVTATKAEERRASLDLVNAALTKIGRGAISFASKSVGLGPNTGAFHRWLKTGLGINDDKVRDLESWAKEVLAADDPGAPVRESWSRTKQKMSESARRRRQKAPSHADEAATVAMLDEPITPQERFLSGEWEFERCTICGKGYTPLTGALGICDGCAPPLIPRASFADDPEGTAKAKAALEAPPACDYALGDAIICEHLERICGAEVERMAPSMAGRVRARVSLEVRG